MLAAVRPRTARVCRQIAAGSNAKVPTAASRPPINIQRRLPPKSTPNRSRPALVGLLLPLVDKAAQVTDSAKTAVSRLHAERRAARQIEYPAFHDRLTGLCNRGMFSRLLEHGLQEARRYNHRLAVSFVHLDRFKNISDTLGHEAGDLLLQEMATKAGHPSLA